MLTSNVSMDALLTFASRVDSNAIDFHFLSLC